MDAELVDSSCERSSVLYDMLTRLVALSPTGDEALNALVRTTCAAALSLPPLPSEGAARPTTPSSRSSPSSSASTCRSISPEQRKAFLGLGRQRFRVTALIFIADFVPRVSAGLEALRLRPIAASHRRGTTTPILPSWCSNTSCRRSAALRALDPVTTEVVRLRGAPSTTAGCASRCARLRRWTPAARESLYDDIERYESSTLLDERHKAALRYVDALIWTPSRIDADVASGVREHFSEAEALELTLDVMRNAGNKIAVALGADAPRVSEGTERYLLGVDGQPVYS